MRQCVQLDLHVVHVYHNSMYYLSELFFQGEHV